MKFSIKDIFSKRDQIRRKVQIWSHLLKKSLMKSLNLRNVTFSRKPICFPKYQYQPISDQCCILGTRTGWFDWLPYEM